MKKDEKNELKVLSTFVDELTNEGLTIEYRCEYCNKLLFKSLLQSKKTIYIVCSRCKKLNVI